MKVRLKLFDNNVKQNKKRIKRKAEERIKRRKIKEK